MVVITANIHGDETTGVATIHAVDEQLATVLRRGTVVMYPTLNPRGLIQQQRLFPDGLDLNRVFPGSPSAEGATRLAGLVWGEITRRKPDAVIDLHADSAVSIPYAIVDRPTHLAPAARARMDEDVLAMAHASGLTVLLEYPDEQYIRYRLDRSLAGAMVNHANIPAVTLEVGPRRAIDPVAVSIASEAVLRILHHLALVSAPVAGAIPAPCSGRWRRTAAPRVRSAGLFAPLLAPGEPFAHGAVLGVVRGLDGTVREVVLAEGHGIVVSWAETAWVEPNTVPGTVGISEG